MSEFHFIYSELWPTCHLPDEWKMSRNAKSTKNDFLGNSQVKSVSSHSNKNFYLQSHKIFYQIFIKPTKMPNKTCWIINNNNLPPFCASFISPTQTPTVGCLEIFSILNYFLLLCRLIIFETPEKLNYALLWADFFWKLEFVTETCL